MNRTISVNVLGAGLALVLATAAPCFSAAQDDTVKGKPTAGGQMKEGGKEMGKAGKSLGHNVRHGRIVRGSKHFGKHVYHGSKHIGKGTANGAETVGKDTARGARKVGATVKKAVKP